MRRCEAIQVHRNASLPGSTPRQIIGGGESDQPVAFDLDPGAVDRERPTCDRPDDRCDLGIGAHRLTGSLGDAGGGQIHTVFDITPVLLAGIRHGHLGELRRALFSTLPGLSRKGRCDTRRGLVGQWKHSITSVRHSIRTDTCTQSGICPSQTSRPAAANTVSNMASVSRPVNVFCWLG